LTSAAYAEHASGAFLIWALFGYVQTFPLEAAFPFKAFFIARALNGLHRWLTDVVDAALTINASLSFQAGRFAGVVRRLTNISHADFPILAVCIVFAPVFHTFTVAPHKQQQQRKQQK